MAPSFRACRTPRRSPCDNPTADPAGAAQGPAEGPAEDPAESASSAGSEAATVLSHVGTPAPPSTENLLQQLITTYGATLKALEQSQTV